MPAVEAGVPAEELPKIVAIDLQPMSPIVGVTLLQGDITSASTATQVIAHFDGNQADLVISDGAPDVTGLHDLDEYVQSQLILAALVIVTATLKHGGTFVAKIFRGRDISILYSQLKLLFTCVTVVKPKSSRNSSIEAFVVCQDFRPPNVDGGMSPDALSRLLEGKEYEVLLDEVDMEEARRSVPFVACGDLRGFDSDASYRLADDPSYEQRDVVCSPVAGMFSH